MDRMDRLLDDLSSSRGHVRQRALASIADCLGASYKLQVAEGNFGALLYGCLNSLIKGSSEEIILSSRTLGLLSITLGFGDKANELHKELLPLIQQAVGSMSGQSLISVINCLAISSFVSANVYETEAAMKTIWHIILSKPSANVLCAAISAWSLLLTSVTDSLHRTYWKRIQMFYFLTILEEDDQSICMAAEDAIDLLLEMEFLKDGCIYKTLEIGDHNLVLHSLSKLFQVEFILDFLGHGFVPQMLENEFLHDVFDFTPEEKTSEEDDQVYYCEREEVAVRVCIPGRMRSQPPTRSAVINKGRTQLLKKKRMLKWARTDDD